MTEPRYAVLVDVETDWPEVVYVGSFDEASAESERILAAHSDIRATVTAVIPAAEALYTTL